MDGAESLAADFLARRHEDVLARCEGSPDLAAAVARHVGEGGRSGMDC
jgi:hypothetical protein